MSPRRTSKASMDRPKRPLSAYNLFFQAERKRFLRQLDRNSSDNLNKMGRAGDERGPKRAKIGFAGLARHVASKWKVIDIDEKTYYTHLAFQDKEWYEMEKLELKRVMKQNTSNEGRISSNPIYDDLWINKNDLNSTSHATFPNTSDDNHEYISTHFPSPQEETLVPLVVNMDNLSTNVLVDNGLAKGPGVWLHPQVSTMRLAEHVGYEILSCELDDESQDFFIGLFA